MDKTHYDNQRLKSLRGGRSLRQVAAEMGGVSHHKINRAERGESTTYDFLCQLAKFYKVPVADLLYAVRKAA